MSILACILLILSALLFMLTFAAGPFSKQPWSKYHLVYSQLNKPLRTGIFITAIIASIFSSLVIMGILAFN